MTRMMSQGDEVRHMEKEGMENRKGQCIWDFAFIC